MAQMSGGAAIVQSLLANGVDTVFGLPGGQLYHLYDALREASSDLRVVTARHEQGAAYMAFGYAASTGRVGVFTVVPGPGILNASAALLTAYGCNEKVLCVSGQIPSVGLGVGAGYLHELPGQLEMIRHVTKHAERIDAPEAAPQAVNRAFEALHCGRPRPVEIEMCMDVMEEVADVGDPTSASIPQDALADPDAIGRAADVLARAQQPLIVVGGGARDAGDALLAIAERLQAPVGAFRQGRGIVSDRHYLSLTYPGIHRLWKHADAVLAVGTRLKYPLMYWGHRDLPIVRVDIDPEEVTRLHTPEVGIVGDAACVLGQLANALESRGGRRPSRRAELEGLKGDMAEAFARIQPQVDFLNVIRDELPDDGIFVDEITQTGFASWYAFPVYRPRQLISSGYQGNLGYGYATAVGVKVANPNRKVVQITGDGGFLYNAQEMSTAVAQRLDLVTILFADGRFGNVHRDQRRHFGDNGNFADNLTNPDFEALAASYGVAPYAAHDAESLRVVLREALQASGPSLIVVRVGEMASPWEFIALGQVRP